MNSSVKGLEDVIQGKSANYKTAATFKIVSKRMY